jgi:hypothetical protein
MRFHIWTIVGLIFSLSLGVSFSLTTASAADSGTSPSKDFFHRKKVHVIQISDGLHLPRYDELVRLPRKTQMSFMKAFQAALLELDAEAKDGETQDTASRLLDFWLSNACADEDNADFCINLGVVRAIGPNCDVAQGAKRHNFNTKEDLADLGDKIADQCKGTQKPCSPVFGFSGSGDLYCVAGNHTSSCAQLAKSDQHTISFATVLQGCVTKNDSTNTDSNPTKADCKKLANFYDAQVQLVQDHCQGRPSTKACGILAAQMTSVQGDLDDLKAATSVDAKALIEGVDQANHAGETLSGGKEDCPPGTTPAPTLRSTVTAPELAGKPATVTPPAPPAPPTPPTAQSKTAGNVLPPSPTQPPVAAPVGGDCSPKDYPSNQAPTFDKVSDYLSNLIPQKASSCSAVTLPNQSVLKALIQNKKPTITIQPQSINGKNMAPINLDETDFAVMEAASATLKGETFKIPTDKLLNAYLPVQVIKSPGAMIVTSTDGKMQKPMQADRGWYATDGTRVRFTSGVPLNGTTVTVVGITLPSDPKQTTPPTEHFVAIADQGQ